MPWYSKNSQARLDTCDPRLRELFNEIIRHYDCAILEGRRGKQTQNEYHRTGRSKLRWPRSKHNKTPSLAVDVAPYPVDWNEGRRFYHFAGFVEGVASQMGLRVRWGGDWDGDREFSDQNFHDLPHFELVKE